MPRQKCHREVYNQTQELWQPFSYSRETSLKRKMTHKERSQSPIKATLEACPPAGLFSYITQYRSAILTLFNTTRGIHSIESFFLSGILLVFPGAN